MFVKTEVIFTFTIELLASIYRLLKPLLYFKFSYRGIKSYILKCKARLFSISLNKDALYKCVLLTLVMYITDLSNSWGKDY